MLSWPWLMLWRGAQADADSLVRLAWLGPLRDRLAQAAAARLQGAKGEADPLALRLEVQDKVRQPSYTWCLWALSQALASRSARRHSS